MKNNLSELSISDLSASITWYEFDIFFNKNLIPEKKSWRIHFDNQVIITKINDNGMDWFKSSTYNNPEFFLSLEAIHSKMGPIIAEMLETGQGIAVQPETESHPFWDAIESHENEYERWLEANRNEFLEIEDELMNIYRTHFQEKFGPADSDDVIIISL